MTTTIYGISNCDTVRRTRRWFDERGITYHFHDFRRDGLTHEQLGRWSSMVGWDALLNRRGTTWRKLTADQRENIDEARAMALMLEQPALIRRPVIEMEDDIMVGFDDELCAQRFGN